MRALGRFCILAFTISSLVGAAVVARGDAVFYLSADPIGVATPPTPVDTLFVQPGASGVLNLFVMTDVRLSLISLDVVNDGGAIAFTGFNVLNPSDRWAFLDGPGSAHPDLLSHIGGVAIPDFLGSGIGPGSPDPGFDATSGYRIATLHYTATATPGTVSELYLRIGQNGVSDWEVNYPNVRLGGHDHPSLVGSDIGVTDDRFDLRIQVVPEPANGLPAGIAVAGLLGCLRRRN
jgi:hypothetical protein